MRLLRAFLQRQLTDNPVGAASAVRRAICSILVCVMHEWTTRGTHVAIIIKSPSIVSIIFHETNDNNLVDNLHLSTMASRLSDSGMSGFSLCQYSGVGGLPGVLLSPAWGGGSVRSCEGVCWSPPHAKITSGGGVKRGLCGRSGLSSSQSNIFPHCTVRTVLSPA